MDMIKKVFIGEIKDINVGERTLTALISTGATDRMDEVLDPAGIDLRNFRKNPVVAWAHDYSALPIGKALWTRKDPKGIISKVKFAEHPFADEVFNLYKDGFLNAFSVGFIPKESTKGNTDKGEPWRTYTKWELLEYSAVPVPANPEALALAMQKGVVHDDKIIDDIQKEMDVEDDDKNDDKNVNGNVDENKGANDAKNDKGLDDLLAENVLLAEEVNGLKNEITELRYKIYEAETKKQELLSEIADEVTLDKVQAHVDGAIRKMFGKVDK